MAKKPKKGKKAKKAARPPTVTVRLKKAEIVKVRDAAKKAGAKSVAVFAKSAILEKADAVLGGEQPPQE